MVEVRKQKTVQTIAALITTYAILGLLMNSVGTVILQSITQYGVTKPHAATLEACKDLSVVVASFLVAASLPKFGLRRSLMTVMCVIGTGALLMPFANGFWANQAMFIVIGLCFGVAKVATYASIGLLRSDAEGHASLTSLIEGVFMLGVLCGIWMFGWFIGLNAGPSGWLRVYFVIAGLCALSFLLWYSAPLDEDAVAPTAELSAAGRMEMLKLLAFPATIYFLLSLFLYVLVEQSIGTWLPTFNNQILHLPAAMSVQMSGIFVAALAIGRLGASGLVQRLGWFWLLLGCIGAMAVLVVSTLPATEGVRPQADMTWFDAPVAAYILPTVGIFMAPIYPIVCSVMLSSLPIERHPATIGLMVIFSALGGTVGSFITGLVFQNFSGQTAFYLVVIPLALLAGAIVAFRRQISTRKPASP